MRVKSVTMITDSTGRRFAYPAAYYDLEASRAEILDLLRAVGFTLERRFRDRAILRKRGGVYRYICFM